MKYIQVKDILVREEENSKFILFNPRTSCIHLISSLGLAIWNCCITERTIESIYEELQNAYDIDNNAKDQYLQAIKEFISGLVSRHLLEEKI